MHQFRLIRLLGVEPPTAEGKKLHSALFLAQQITRQCWYNFDLKQGRVRSDELNREMVLVYETGFAGLLGTAGMNRVDGDEQLRETLVYFLSQADEVVEAAATAAFFAEEQLGDPSSKLRWYRSLSPSVVSEASLLAAHTRQEATRAGNTVAPSANAG